ncbi:MAG: outer membrane beta-barrel protein, partial [Bacteroidota bacterium]
MKRYAFVAFFLICSTTLLGQTTFGIRAGVNGSMFVGDDTDIFNEINELGEEVEAEYKIAYHGGVYARVPISNSVYFRPELLYSLKGATTRDV